MRKHNGMRPQDIPILLKVIALNKSEWQLMDLAKSLFISLSEISESLSRSKEAGLIDYKKKNLNKQSLIEFLEHGIKYVFPQKPGAMVRGMLTAHSHPFMQKYFSSEMKYVWPDVQGDEFGSMIEPFYPKQVQAAKIDAEFYKLMALVDVIRVGKTREIKRAVEELNNLIVR
jgi:predicted transcriptional regulator